MNKKRINIFSIRAPDPTGKGDQTALFQRCELLSDFSEVSEIRIFYISGKFKGQLPNKCSLIKCKPTYFLKFIMFFKYFFMNRYPIQASIFYNSHFVSAVKDTTSNDIIWLLSIRLIYLYQLKKDNVIDFIDPLSQTYEHFSNGQNFFFKNLMCFEANRLRNLEQKMTKLCPLNLFVSNIDCNISHLEKKNVFSIPLYQRKSGLNIKIHEANKYDNFVFHGSLNYKPNIDAIQFLVSEILPDYHRKYGEVNLKVIGRSPDRKLKHLLLNSKFNIHLVSDPPDINAELTSDCSVYVAPMRIGSGMQNKILEAVDLGIPIITSARAAAPFNFEHGQHCLIAKSVSDYSKYMYDLKNNVSFSKKLSSRAQTHIHDNLQKLEVQKQLHQTLQMTILNL